ncbi:winged helix-turn-helix transcriptional regulator [Elongatibacter sediminis]|uniref:Helix-turn-helix domain-containing protein n=1 Tax=Elongatibacter sediminis TaxID=3119006 RepID=A0AAW9RGB4_9GAMM
MSKLMETRASSINRALDQIGDKWSLLIIGDVMWGIKTFGELLAATGMSRGVLSDRLKWLESIDCLQKRYTDENRRRPTYHLTRKTIDLYDTAMMSLNWERRFYSEPEMDAIQLVHKDCGNIFTPKMACRHCGRDVLAADVEFHDGPGATRDLRKMKVRRRSSKSIRDIPSGRAQYKNLIHLIGDRWTANVIALAFHGLKRFEEFHRELPIATNVLSDRLKFLTQEGVFLAVPYCERPLRFNYALSEKGLALFPFFLALLQWGDTWCGDGSGPPMMLIHTTCGEPLHGEVRCDACDGRILAYRVHQELLPIPAETS